jgi:hypothetical protein
LVNGYWPLLLITRTDTGTVIWLQNYLIILLSLAYFFQNYQKIIGKLFDLYDYLFWGYKFEDFTGIFDRKKLTEKEKKKCFICSCPFILADLFISIL